MYIEEAISLCFQDSVKETCIHLKSENSTVLPVDRIERNFAQRPPPVLYKSFDNPFSVEMNL